MPPTIMPSSVMRVLSRLSSPLRTTRTTPLSLRLPAQALPLSRRFQSSSPLTEQPASAPKSRPAHAPPKPPQSRPEYEMTFTCKPCGTRSTHRVSKQGYHYGSTLITCPECRNRHIISDHLNIFGDKHMTIEDLMRERGQLVKKGTLSEDGDLEFWEDGRSTKRNAKEGSSEPKGIE